MLTNTVCTSGSATSFAGPQKPENALAQGCTKFGLRHLRTSLRWQIDGHLVSIVEGIHDGCHPRSELHSCKHRPTSTQLCHLVCPHVVDPGTELSMSVHHNLKRSDLGVDASPAQSGRDLQLVHLRHDVHCLVTIHIQF